MIIMFTFEEAEFGLAGMAGAQGIYFVLVVLVNALGLILADREMDKKKVAEHPEGEYSWFEIFLILAPASAIVTMSLLEIIGVKFWASMLLSLMMGVIFRPLLPELTKLALDKITGLLSVLFGRYGG